ncbi:MAG: cyclic nucleotide-binding domain-containing protein [Erysipelotrichaceae bacterium]
MENIYTVCQKYFSKEIVDNSKLIYVKSGETIISQQQKSKYLFYMLKGKCAVKVLMSNGKTLIVNTLKAPSLIGELELIRNISPFSVVALNNCQLLAIDLDKYKNYLVNDLHFMKALCYDLVGKERKETLKLINSFAFPFENRLAKFILDNRQYDCFSIKKVEIAESLGVSYRHVESLMNSFCQKGYLRKEKLTYWIIDEQALIELARAY